MCGIAGILSINPKWHQLMPGMLNHIQHRGPDCTNQWSSSSKTTTLGHTRLSILDLSALGNQPMHSHCGNYTIVYNGEIYNFKEIRQQLLLAGYSFKSDCDTEVIIYAYQEYGNNFVKKLNGMFSISIWNHYNSELYLARDLCGMKPLYYFQKDDLFAFCSEVLALRPLISKVNPLAKELYLLLGSVPEPLTIFEDIQAFPAGFYGIFQNNELKLTQFQSYKFQPKIVSNYQNIVETTRALLHKAVDRHLISDAPIGTFLSGGVDSSALTAIAANFKSNITTVSLTFDESEYSEEKYVDIICDKYKVNRFKYKVTASDFLQESQNFIKCMDQPSVDGLNTFLAAKAAKEAGLKVVLSGVGGDELFYGYPSYKRVKVLSLLSKLPSILLTKLSKIKRFNKLSYLSTDLAQKEYLCSRSLYPLTSKNSKEAYCFIQNLQDLNLEKKHPIDNIGYYELSMYLKNQLLRDSDNFGMAHSIEIRIPLLDLDLIKYCLRIQPELKLDPLINKKVFVDAMSNDLPKQITHRKKMGFELPFKHWIKNNLDLFKISDQDSMDQFIRGDLHWSRLWHQWTLEQYLEKVKL
ncbi:asparagine synthase (glutamine-hydrolyzing) [bacterium]|nr:asparagine synthase (glutamine-hydrolyzing) [bacterium]